nr:MAG TPA: hypothetical protein [Caudoviricetes sp.]
MHTGRYRRAPGGPGRDGGGAAGPPRAVHGVHTELHPV